MKEKLAMRKSEGCQRAISKPPKLLPRIHNSTKHVSTEKRFHLNLLIYNTLTEMATKSIKKLSYIFADTEKSRIFASLLRNKAIIKRKRFGV